MLPERLLAGRLCWGTPLPTRLWKKPPSEGGPERRKPQEGERAPQVRKRQISLRVQKPPLAPGPP